MFKRHRSEKSNRYQWLLLERGIQDWIFTKVHGNLIPIQKNQFLSDTCLKDIALTIKSIGVELLINNRWYLIEAQRYNRHSIILRIFDITDEKALLLVDPLTQLYNHNYLTEIDSNYRYCVIVDIRDFVTINRTYSYQYGDNLLKSLASQFNLLAPLVLRDYSDNFVLFTDEIDLLLGKIETVYQQLELNYYLGYARRYYESTSELYAKADRALHCGIENIRQLNQLSFCYRAVAVGKFQRFFELSHSGRMGRKTVTTICQWQKLLSLHIGAKVG